MSNDGAMRLGMVGCGAISHVHGNAAQSIASVRFDACCDIREDVAQRWATQYGCRGVYTDYEEMIVRENLDGVLLATWPVQHREQIERCLAAGVRSILCEKALATTGKDALEIWRMVRESDAFLMEGFMYRHHPAIRLIKSRLESGELGPVDYVRASFSQYDPEQASADDDTRSWRKRKECGGGVPYDFACYCVNACRHYAESTPVRVYCRGDVSEKYGTISRMYGLIEYDSGIVGIVESSKRALASGELQVTCAQGVLHLPQPWVMNHDVLLTEQRGMLLTRPGKQVHTVRKSDSYRLQLQNFADVVRGAAEPVVPLAESVVNAFTIEALVASAEEKRIVELRIPEIVLAEVAQ